MVAGCMSKGSDSNSATLEECFSRLDDSVRRSLAGESSPMKLGLVALAIAEGICGVQFISADEICEALGSAGIALTPMALKRAFARAGNLVIRRVIDKETKYRISLPGLDLVKGKLPEGNLSVMYISAGQPRTARKHLADILSHLSGVVRVADPYYGERSLDAIEMIPATCGVRFLTAKTTESEDKLRRLISDFRRERPSTEIRLYPKPQEMHDRYMLTEDMLMVVGHGFKDIGRRESFVILVGKDIAPDLHSTVVNSFDLRWAAATQI